jgi:hypothetical protein
MLTQGLSQAQIFGLIGFGGIFWAAAVLTVRYAGHIFYANNLRRISTFIASIPVIYIMLFISEGFLGIRSKQRLISVVIMTATALLMDGVGFMWFPTLYENPLLKKKNSQLAVSISRMGAAWILWGAGLGLWIALLT